MTAAAQLCPVLQAKHILSTLASQWSQYNGKAPSVGQFYSSPLVNGRTHTHISLHTHTHTHTHIGLHTHTHTYIGLHTHTHTHTDTSENVEVVFALSLACCASLQEIGRASCRDR